MPIPRLTPTKVAQARQCMHAWYLECYGNPFDKVEPDAGTLLIWERGKDFEQQMVATLPSYSEPVWDGKDWRAGHDATLALMKKGRPWIYQAVLLHDRGAGLPDLLKRVEFSSSLGNHSYMPVDIKSHKSLTIKDRFQLATHALFLEPVLGYRPTVGAIWLKTGYIEEVDLTLDQTEFVSILSQMDQVREGRLTTRGLRCSECRMCAWSAYCEAVWRHEESICLLYGATGQTAQKLVEAGYTSWRNLVSSTPSELSSRAAIREQSAQGFWLSAKAWDSGQPQLKHPVEFSGTTTPVYFYDIETFGETTYLHGVVRVMSGKREERQFLARRPVEEGKSWHAFLNYLACDHDAIVYCWSDYEFSFVNRLWEKYGGNDQGYKHLNGMIDQCAFVREHFALPTSTYSIKEVAPIFGFRWRAEDAGGLNSEAWYREWLDSGDQVILDKILAYNLDDVIAMEVIDLGLKRSFGG